MKETQSDEWEKIMTAGEHVAYAYQEMVNAADALANELGYSQDYVLRQVLPKTMGERRDGERVLAWLNGRRGEIVSMLLGRMRAREQAARRETLLARLHLTEDEQQLLGITGGQ